MAVLLVSGGAGYWLLHTPPSSRPGTPVRPGNGLTFEQAWAPLAPLVSNASGGPWSLVSILGVAIPVPAAGVPNFNAATGLNHSFAVCGGLDGVTPWNGSAIPVFTGSRNSGAAPFWSLMFRNASHAFLYATSLLGEPRTYPVVASSACALAAGLAGAGPINSSIGLDTVAVAGLAASVAGDAFSRYNSPFGTYYVLGASQLEFLDSGSTGWSINYFRCGQVGVWNLQNYSVALINRTGQGWGLDVGFISCSLPAYSLSFQNPSTNVTPPGSPGGYLQSVFQVTDNLSGRPFDDGWGLQPWMFTVNVTVSGGVPLPPSPATCQSWTPSLDGCLAPESGWFALLLSPSGGWVDSYPSAVGARTWSEPAAQLCSQDRLVIVSAPGQNLTGGEVFVQGILAGPTIAGAFGIQP